MTACTAIQTHAILMELLWVIRYLFMSALLKRQHVAHQWYPTLDETRSDLFDYIERLHHLRVWSGISRQDRRRSVAYSVREDGVEPRRFVQKSVMGVLGRAGI